MTGVQTCALPIYQINYDATSLIVWKAPLPEPPVSNQMFEYVQKGGVVLFLPPAEDSNSSFGGIGWDPIVDAPKDKFFIMKDWNRNESLLRDALDGAPLPVDRLRGIKRRGLAGDFVTLAQWEDDQPLLARRVIEQGQVLFLTTLPDYTWSNLEQTALHLVALQRGLDEGSRRLGAGFFGVAGQDSARPQGEEIRSRIDSYQSQDQTLGNADFEAGVYRLGERTVAVNRPESEDSLEVITDTDLSSALADTSYSLLEDQDASGDSSLSHPIWRAFFLAMLVFLILEAILCLQPKRVDPNTAPTPQPTS